METPAQVRMRHILSAGAVSRVVVPWRAVPEGGVTALPESPANGSWAGNGARINPGPHEFHVDPGHFRAWCRERGHLFCRLSAVREIMRPVAIPGDEVRWGVCDGLHREAHEFVPA